MKHQQAAVYSLVLSPIAGATTARTANIDCQGADYATLALNVGIEVNTNSTNVVVALLESDDTTASNFATFNATYNRTIDNVAATQYVMHVDRTNGSRKRYLQLSVTPDTTTNGAVLTSAVAILDKEVRGLNSANAANIAVG